MLKSHVASRHGYRLAMAGLVFAMFFSLAATSSAQLLRRPRRAPAAEPSAAAQIQTTGMPGAPSATTTIDGKQLPPPDPTFGGVIKDNALQSKAWWAPRVVPPKGGAEHAARS